MATVKDTDLKALVAVLSAKEQEIADLSARLADATTRLAACEQHRAQLIRDRDEALGVLTGGLTDVPKITLSPADQATLDQQIADVNANAEKWQNAWAGLKVTAIKGLKSYLGGLGLPFV